MNRTERLQEVLRLEGLAAAATTRAKYYRDELALEARDELKREGSAPTWRIPDLATISLSVSRETPYVLDEHLLLTWCKQRHPDEVETVEQVRGAFRGHLLATGILSGDSVAEATTGEVIPGLGVRPGGVPQSLTVRPTHAARVVFAAMGERTLEELLAPPAEPQGHLDMADLPTGGGSDA
jgi:hypothetical protein